MFAVSVGAVATPSLPVTTVAVVLPPVKVPLAVVVVTGTVNVILTPDIGVRSLAVARTRIVPAVCEI